MPKAGPLRREGRPVREGGGPVNPSGHERKRDAKAGRRSALPIEGGRHGGVTLLLEREQDLQRILAALASARSGAGGVVALEGSAGIGKTRLLRTAMELPLPPRG